MKFRLRIDEQDDQTLISFVDPYKTYVIVQHTLPHGNPHYHAYIEDVMSLSIDAFRARVKRYFKVSKASDYSVKKCDEDKVNEYVQYLHNTKHGNEWRVVAVRNFDTNLLSELQKAAKDISEDFSSRHTREKKPKGPTIFQLAQEVQDMYEETHEEEISIERYTQCAISICYKYHKTAEPHMLIKIISTAMARSEKGKVVLVQKCQNYFQMQ